MRAVSGKRDRVSFGQLRAGLLIAWEGQFQNGCNGPKPGDIYELRMSESGTLWGHLNFPCSMPPEGSSSPRAAQMFWPLVRYVERGWKVYKNIGEALGDRAEYQDAIGSVAAGW